MGYIRGGRESFRSGGRVEWRRRERVQVSPYGCSLEVEKALRAELAKIGLKPPADRFTSNDYEWAVTQIAYPPQLTNSPNATRLQ